MIEIFLEEEHVREKLFPLTHTRPVAELRVGILTIREKWERLFGCAILKGPGTPGKAQRIPANWIPTRALIDNIRKAATRKAPFSGAPDQTTILTYPWHIFQHNDVEIRRDFALLTKGRKSAVIPSGNKVISRGNIFIEKGAKVQHAFINASAGPVYVGRDAEIMEGAMIRGPVAIGDRAVIKMGAAIYGATTIGPDCVAGGEIKNSVIMEFSNKAHHGYLGDSVIGAWCNLGAGCSNSNLKNNAGVVKVWSESESRMVEAGQKCGLIMGDYSRAGINTSFNTGTVAGVCCQITSAELTPGFIPHFSWGLAERYLLDKAVRDIAAWKQLKKQSLTENEIQTLTHIFEKKSTRT